MIRRTYISNQVGGQIHIAEAGSGPTVLFLHQTPRSWDEFREVMHILKGNLRLIAMDLPGMGASDSIGTNPCIETYADAAECVAQWSAATPLIICGHHTGGVVAIELAARRPDLVTSLILSSTPWMDASTRRARAKTTTIDSIKRTRNGHHLMSLWQQRSPYYPDKTDYLDRFMASALSARNPASGHHAVSQYHMERAAPNIHCPVLLIEHQKDPFAAQHMSALLKAFPDAAVQVIPHGQVALEVTAPDFAGIVKQWVHNQIPYTSPMSMEP